jgi:hypothetical protein
MTATAKAGPYTYDWTPSINFVGADSGPNVINFTNETKLNGTGSTGIVASNPTFNSNDAGTWSNKDVAFKVTIMDGGQQDTEVFNGKINGTYNGSTVSTVTITLTDPTLTRNFTLNGDAFSLMMSPSTPIPVKSSNTIAAVSGFLTVDGGSGGGPQPPGGGTNDTPEPSTILLSMLGIGGLGLRAWRNRKRVTA